MASESDTAESLIVQERDEKDFDRRNKPYNIDTAIHAKENAGYEIELHIEGTKGDEQIEPNLKVAEGNTGECFLCPPSVEKVVYEDIFRQSEDCPEGISDDTNNQQVIKKIATAEEAEQRPIESPGLDAKDKENTTCDPEKCLEKILPSNPPASPEKFQENVSKADDLEYTSTEVVQGPDVMEETENKRSKKDGDEKTTSSEAEDSNKPQTSSSPTEGNQESMSDIIKHVEELDTSTGESNDTVEEKKDLYEAGIDCNLQEASESISEKDVDDMTGLCETLKSKSELEDNNGNITKFQQKDMDKGKGENSDEEAFSSNTEFGIIMKGPPQTTTINPEECTVKNMMMQERKTKDIQGEIFTLTSENTEAVEPIEEISFSVLGSSRSWTANSKDRKDYIDKLGVRYVSADIKKNITTERENNISQKQDDLCLGYNTIAKVETNGKQNLGFELQPEELEKQVIEDSSQEKFYNEQASEVSKNIEFTSSERTVDEEIERKGIGDATNITKEEGVPEVLESEAEERHAIKIQEELTESETKDMAFDSNVQESSIVTSTNTNSSLVESMGKFSAKGEQLSERSIDNGTAEESSNMKQDVESKNEANDTTATSYSANLSFESMDLSEKEEAEMEVYILSQEHEYSIGKEDIGSAEEGVELNETIEKPDSCTYADSAYEEDVTSEETRISESGEISMDTKQYGISTEYLLQKVYNEEQTHCNVKIGIVEAEDSKGMLEEAHELAKEQYFEEPQSIAKGTVQEDSLIAMMEKKADDKEFEIKNLYPPRHHDDSSMQEPELGALEKSGSYENQEAEELEYTRFEESDTEKTEGNHENIENSQSQNAPINTYNNGMQVAEAEDKADTQHENTEDEKLYNSILNASSTQDTNIKSNSIGEQRDAKTQAQTSFIEIQDTGANHEDIVHKGFEESATCIERQEQKILEEPTTVIEVQNHVPSEESVRIFSKDVRVNETKESAMEKQQCCVEGDRTSNIPNGAPSYEDSKVDSIEEKWNTENIVGESDQDINAKSDSIEVLRDEEAYRQINFNEISETRVVDNEKIMNQSSEESNSCCAIQGQESESASVEACTPSPLNEVKEYVPSTNESGEDIKESKEKADAIDKQIEEPDMTIRGLDAHKGREDEIPPKTENFMNISKEGKIQEINAQFDSIEKEKEAEQTCSYETKETKIDNDIVNQSSKANDSCSSGYRDQEIAQVSTPLKVVEIPIASKEIHTECSRTDFQGKGIEIGTSIKEQHCGAEDPEVITNGVSSNKVEKELELHGYTHSNEKQCIDDDKIEMDSIEVLKDDKTHDKGIYEKDNVNQDKVGNQSSGENNSCMDKQDQEIVQASIPITEAENLVPIIDRCTNTCEDIQISEVKDEASIGKEQYSTEMEDLDKTTNGVTSYEYVKMTRLVNPEKAMDTVDNASEQPSDRNDNMQNKLQEQQHENQNELAKSDEIAGSNSHEIVPQEDMAEAFDTSTNVDIQQANWQICPPLVEELGTLSAQNNEVSIYGSELKHDSRDVCSREINAKHSTQKMELDDAEKEVTFPNSMNVHINCQEINNTEVRYNFTEDETKESHQTESCKNLEEIQGTTNPVTELKVKADEKSSEKPAQEICLPEVKQREHKVPGIKDEPKYSMAKQEQATKSQTTECEGEPIKDTMPKQEAEKGQTTGDSTAKPESLSSEFEGSSSMSDNKMHTEPMSYSDCSLPAIVTKNKRKDSQKSLESPIVSPPIGSGCGSLSKESTKYHDQTKISQQVSGPYAEELTETYEAHQEMHHQIKRSQTTAGERSLPDFGAHKATRKDDKHDKNTVTEETNASDDSKNFEGEAMIESYQEALSDKATECQVNSMDKVDIASEHPSDINANMQEYLRDKKHENQLDLTETHEIDGSNSQDTLLQADMAEAFHVTTILKIQQANTCQMCPPHIKELNYSSAKDTQSIANGSEFKQDSRGVCSGEINASQSTGKLELDDAESTVTFPNPIILQTASCKNVEKIHGTTKPVTELEVKLNEISSKNPEQETCLPEVEQKEIKVPSFEDYSVKESMAKEELVEKGKRTDESKAELENSSLEFKDEPIKDSMPEQELAESDETIGCGPSSKVSCKFHDKTKSSQQVSKPRGEELTETNETQEKMHYQLKSSQLIAGEGSLTDFGGHEATRNKDKHDKNTVLPYDPTLEQQNMHKTESLDNEEEAVLEEEWETNTELINPAVDGEAIVSSTGKALTRNLYSEQGCQMEERKDDDHPHVQSIAAEKGLELEGNHNNLSATSELQDPCNNILMEEASEELVDATVEIGNKRYIQDDSRVELEEQDKTVTCTQKGVSVIDLERKEATLYLPKGPVKESSEEPAADSPRIIGKGESQEHVHQEGAVEPIKTQADSNPLDTSINFPSNIMLESSAQANLMVSDMTAQREQVIIHKEANNERENALIISKFDEEKDDEQEDLDMKVPLISDMELKATHKKPHNILLGVGSKVKNSISKVKKAISCTTSEFASEDAIIKLNKPKNADKA